MPRRAPGGRSPVRPLPAQAVLRRPMAGVDRGTRAGLRRAGIYVRPAHRPRRPPGAPMTEQTIAGLLAAADLHEPSPLGGLIARLTADGRLRGARHGGRAIGPAGLAGISVSGVTHDSREVAGGWLFVAVPGLHADGHDFVAAAAAAGGAAGVVAPPPPP